MLFLKKKRLPRRRMPSPGPFPGTGMRIFRTGNAERIKNSLRDRVTTLLPKKDHYGAVMLRNTRPFPLVAAAVSLAGLLFCLWVFFTGGEALCLTDGCTLFQDFRLAGVSLWQAGAVLFAVLLLLAFARLVQAAFFCAALALAADAVLLCIMIFTAPCVNCLIVGTLIALSFLAFRSEAMPREKERSALALVWGLLLVVNAGGVVRDLSEPWSPLPGTEQAAVHVYFSPSCRACQTLLSRSEDMKDAAWFPVPEDTRDIWVISAMEENLQKGMPLAEAVNAAQKAVPALPDFQQDQSFRFGLLRPGMLLLQFRLWQNHAHVLSAGSDRLPFLEFQGLPAFLTEEPAPADTPAVPEEPSSGLFPGMNVAGFCDGTADSPCEEAAPQGSGEGLIDTSGMLP